MHEDLRGAGDDIVIEYADLAIAESLVELTGTRVEGRYAKKDMACAREKTFGLGKKRCTDRPATELRSDGDRGNVGRTGDSAWMQEDKTAAPTRIASHQQRVFGMGATGKTVLVIAT